MQINPIMKGYGSMKARKFLYYLGTSLSLFIGLWHFTVPYLFNWASYISPEYRSLIVAMDWINFFFSLLLSGLSLLLLFFGRKILAGNKELLVFYCLLVFVWFCRVILSFIEPFPVGALAQQMSSLVIFIILLLSVRFK